MSRMVHCVKLGRDAEGLDFPPLPGEIGKKLYDNVSKEAWAAWVKHQTMLINENRLNLADPKARQYLQQQLQNYFFGAGADEVAGFVPPSA
ncbi:oxidative damage protection protein [Jeongeupia sp. USM3]|uniref:oxidative damage protection protein n=1 Tax=Jeongeupia sp. USM3 TaxID=1906741 RepID=UPI00089DF292|nr:oxidative damage protection protein [Jeongeupia sp. USM3]AOY00867.1 oxidative damage protection protein [Jeongeupia sp. USM3]